MPFSHPDAQRAYLITRFARNPAGAVEARLVLIVEYDYGLSFNHENPDPDYSFKHLSRSVGEYVAGRPEISEAELRPTGFALARRE